MRWGPPPPDRIRDVVAFVLATGAVASLVVASIGAAVHRGPISQEESALLSTALGAAIGAVATYLGFGRDSSPPGPPDQ